MSCASLGRPVKAAASVEDALAEELAEVVDDDPVEDALAEEEDVAEVVVDVDDASVVEEAARNLMPRSSAATWLTRRIERTKTDMERS